MSASDSGSEIHTGPQTQSQASSRGAHKNTWYVTFDLQVNEEGVVNQLRALESSKFRQERLKRASTISFSISTDGSVGSPATPGVPPSPEKSAQIRGFISGGTMYESSVRKWLTNPEISNLELHPISNRFDDSFIKSFLLDSALPGESAIQGRRLRVDTMQASDVTRKRAGGRPRKRPIEGPIPPECEVGTGSVPSLPPTPQQHQLQLGALPAPAPAGAPAPAPRSTGGISAQQPFLGYVAAGC